MLSPVGIELLTGSPNLTWYVLVLSCDLWWWLYVSFLCYQFNIINPMEGLNFLSIFIEFNFVFLLIHFLAYLVYYCSLWFCRPHSSLPFAVFISILAIYVDSCRKLSLSSLSRYHFLPPIFLGIEMYSSMMTVIWSVSFLFYLVQSLSLFINSIYYLFCYSFPSILCNPCLCNPCLSCAILVWYSWCPEYMLSVIFSPFLFLVQRDGI